MRDIIQNVKSVLQKQTIKYQNSYHQLDEKLCTPDYFRRRLTIEKRRVERLNYNSSLIIFSLKNHNNNNGKNDKSLGLKIKHFVEIIYSSIRETDEICLFNDQMILILLPDTDYTGSQYVCAKIFDKLSKTYSLSNEFIYNDFDIEIISYPAKQTENKLPKDIRLNRTNVENINIIDNNSSNKESNNSNFKKKYIKGLNLCVSTSNGSSDNIPILDSFFLDQQLVSNFHLLIKKIIKRAIDIIGSMIGLIILLPFMMLIALLIKSTSLGPILFKQKRMGYRGKIFTLLKYRSMYNNCDSYAHHNYIKKYINGKNGEINNGSLNNPFYKMKNDQRITPIGRFLRNTNIDELPQLLNVLKGDMSLVGPRPPIPYEVDEYQNWHYRRILEAKPGITGLWQVSGWNKTTFNEMVRFDIYYANNWSISMDIKILLKTIKTILFYGQSVEKYS